MAFMNRWRFPLGGEKVSRRDLLRSVGAVGCAIGASSLIHHVTPGGVFMSDENLIPAKEAVDHLILGAADLDQGVAWLEKLTGVKAVIGGVHPGRGTRNALASLGRRQYLEIMAPDPAQDGAALPYDLKTLAAPRLVHWAAVTNDIDLIARKAGMAGIEVFGPRDGSRARPDGRMLKWKTLDVQNRMGGVRFMPIPFFIQWAGDSLHPSQDSPKGLELQSIEMEHPDAANMLKLLHSLGIQARIKQAKDPRLRAWLKTPNGKIELT
jgi:hypothetical protein